MLRFVSGHVALYHKSICHLHTYLPVCVLEEKEEKRVISYSFSDCVSSRQG